MSDGRKGARLGSPSHKFPSITMCSLMLILGQTGKSSACLKHHLVLSNWAGWFVSTWHPRHTWKEGISAEELSPSDWPGVCGGIFSVND